MATIKRSELIHFSKTASREDVLQLAPSKRAELVESALTSLYRMTSKTERNELLSLVQAIMREDSTVATLFQDTAYAVCNRHLVITFVNDIFLKRSKVEAKDVMGRSLYFESAYEGTQIEQLYSMVMETRMVGDALVRYAATAASGEEYDGWFVLVVIPLEEGGIGVLSRFAKKREEIAEEIDPDLPGAPRYIVL
ncbi:MAG TPA: hypothetical protein VFD13_01365 [Candidatus Kapabacteria bacterium]|nr:hypothetical protein [Candidatus Kapabacteria bacterium]